MDLFLLALPVILVVVAIAFPSLVSAALCEWLAVRKNRNGFLWGFFGLFFPVALVFLLIVKPKEAT